MLGIFSHVLFSLFAFRSLLHILCFIGIIISSTVSANSFCQIFDIFNYRCVLYAKVSTKLTEIKYKSTTSTSNKLDETIPLNTAIKATKNAVVGNYPAKMRSIKPLDHANMVFWPKVRRTLGLDENSGKYLKLRKLLAKLNLGIFEEDYNIEIGARGQKFNFSNAVPVPGMPEMYIYDDELWLMNASMIAKAHVVMTTTVFATLLMCDYVIFVPFLSMIVSSFFIFIVLLFSRSNRLGIHSIPAAWSYVLPLLITSTTMTILTMTSFNLVNHGLTAFCARFVHLTGQNQCSYLMDYFTKEQKLGRRDLYWHIKHSQINYLVTTVFWFAELAVVLIRFICAADFQMVSITIRKRSYIDDFDEDINKPGELELIDIIREARKQAKRE